MGSVQKIKKKILFFNLKDFIFYISVILILWWIFKDIVENQD